MLNLHLVGAVSFFLARDLNDRSILEQTDRWLTCLRSRSDLAIPSVRLSDFPIELLLQLLAPSIQLLFASAHAVKGYGMPKSPMIW